MLLEKLLAPIRTPQRPGAALFSRHLMRAWPYSVAGALRSPASGLRRAGCWKEKPYLRVSSGGK
jgi:hypothetical protein